MLRTMIFFVLSGLACSLACGPALAQGKGAERPVGAVRTAAPAPVAASPEQGKRAGVAGDPIPDLPPLPGEIAAPAGGNVPVGNGSGAGSAAAGRPVGSLPDGTAGVSPDGVSPDGVSPAGVSPDGVSGNTVGGDASPSLETGDASSADDHIVETVKLGGEDAVTEIGGVEQAGSYEETVAEEEETSATKVDVVAPQESKDSFIKPLTDDQVADDPSVHDPSRVTYATTRRNARTMSLTVPGPRGIISDRNGLVMARSEVAYQPSISFGQQQDESEASILGIARRVMEEYRKLGITLYEKTDEQILEHYKSRRWLPLPVGPTMREAELKPVREQVGAIAHAYMMPLYIRNYPNKESACHILGYTGAQAKLPTGPINHNDPIFQRQEGRSGLELNFNKQLTGQPGIWRLMFDEQGNKILDELQTKPRPGGTVVTTLNLEWQKAAEKALREHTNGRGAFVMVDVHTGEILVMASTPNFDPNTFIPSISQKDYDQLRNDPNNPLVSRAFAGVYPPASTFKTVTVAAALRHHIITENTYVSCPYSVRIGGHEFRNHSGFSGSINCITALMISNNPFMYLTAALLNPHIGAHRLCEMARRLGYGSTTGIPLPDKAGIVPDEAWMHRNYGRGFMSGDEANMAIGQGPLLATPLQVAHAISGIANGSYLPKLQLIRQILDTDGNVVFQFTPAEQTNLKDMQEAFATVRRGMAGVVAGGTGRRAALSYVSNAGKTGTAQWGRPSDDCRLAWFAGFLPVEEPRYAYAALYEGRPHQRIGGGASAGTIVKSFFESIKPSMKAELEKPLNAAPVESTRPMTEEEAEEQRVEQEQQEQRAEEAARREERNKTSGWSTGRQRH